MHPVLFELGGFTLYTYGFFMALAFISGSLLAVRLGRRIGLAPHVVSDLCLWTIVVGMLGARLTFVAQNLELYAQAPGQILNFREGGISIQGGLVFGLATTAWLCRRQGIAWLTGLDLVSAPILWGMALGRIGCLLHGCCHGKHADLPWSVCYPEGSRLGGDPRHPVQLYEMGLDLLLMAGVLHLFFRGRFPGQAFWLMFGGYGGVRFLTELFREGAAAGPFTPAQWLSLVFVLVGALGVAGRLRGARGGPRV